MCSKAHVLFPGWCFVILAMRLHALYLARRGGEPRKGLTSNLVTLLQWLFLKYSNTELFIMNESIQPVSIQPAMNTQNSNPRPTKKESWKLKRNNNKIHCSQLSTGWPPPSTCPGTVLGSPSLTEGLSAACGLGCPCHLFTMIYSIFIIIHDPTQPQDPWWVHPHQYWSANFTYVNTPHCLYKHTIEIIKKITKLINNTTVIIIR